MPRKDLVGIRSSDYQRIELAITDFEHDVMISIDVEHSGGLAGGGS